MGISGAFRIRSVAMAGNRTTVFGIVLKTEIVLTGGNGTAKSATCVDTAFPFLAPAVRVSSAT